VLALSWPQIDEIVCRFEALNPYDRAIVNGSVLEVESENYDPSTTERKQLHCYAISAKRYALYNLDEHGQPVVRKTHDEDDNNGESAFDENTTAPDELRKHSEHGLGHLLNPTDPEDDSRDWIARLWQYIIRTDARSDELAGQTAPRVADRARRASAEPEWLDRPALTRTTITSPRLLQPFVEHNRQRPVADRIRPYNFLLVAHAHQPGLQALPERFLLVAPYESDPRKWRRLPWTNAYQPGSRYQIAHNRGGELLDGFVYVKTYRDVLADYRTHPEAKSLGPDGEPCDRATIGRLSRRPVRVDAGAVHYIGKESNKIDEALSGLITDLDDVLTEYPNPAHDALRRLVAPIIRELPIREVATGTGVSVRTVKRARGGQSVGKAARAALTAYATRHARSELRAAGIRPPADHEALLATYLDRHTHPAPEPQLCACGCGQQIPPQRRGRRRTWHSDACRKRAARRQPKSKR
jgi:hypothetical protein